MCGVPLTQSYSAHPVFYQSVCQTDYGMALLCYAWCTYLENERANMRKTSMTAPFVNLGTHRRAREVQGTLALIKNEGGRCTSSKSLTSSLTSRGVSSKKEMPPGIVIEKYFLSVIMSSRICDSSAE